MSLTIKPLAAALLGMTFAATSLAEPAQKKHYGDPPDENHAWGVHDMDRPLPPLITPGTFPTQQTPGTAPSDAIALFDGTSLDAFASSKGGEPKWLIENGELVVNPKTGAITTKQSFGDCQLHVEWLVPGVAANRHGQGRGNSGIFLMGRYEIQVLDTMENKTYADGMAGSIYGQNPPMVNPGLGLDKWQTYDIIFRRPHFDDKGNCIKPGTVTVLHNGVLVQDHWELEGPTLHKKRTKYVAHGDSAPINFQDHGEPTRYRNIWIRPLPEKPTASVKAAE